MIQKSPYQIIVRPIVTEKAMNLIDNDSSQYTFEVTGTANKHEIKWAVQTAYDVKVTKVTTSTIKGKNKYSRQRGIRVGKKPDVKKAIVTLAAGQQIELM